MPNSVSAYHSKSQQVKSKSSRSTPAQVIRKKCLDCSAGSYKEVKLCPVTICPLWLWRFGRRPETVEAKNPNLLNPDWIIAEGYRDGMAELEEENSSYLDINSQEAKTSPEHLEDTQSKKSRAVSAKLTAKANQGVDRD